MTWGEVLQASVMTWDGVAKPPVMPRSGGGPPPLGLLERDIKHKETRAFQSGFKLNTNQLSTARTYIKGTDHELATQYPGQFHG